LAFTNIVAGLEDLKEAGQTDLLEEVSMRMRENLSHSAVDGGDGMAPCLSSQMLGEENLACLPTALGYRVVTAPRLGIARMSDAEAEPLMALAGV
ncbi:MAG TPA: hypothetical protein VEX86_22365, partial [Longimicrobium sp.]|nr:hypothetical protein [Longimicrobium sp.]